jgi:hypothetical protein
VFPSAARRTGRSDEPAAPGNCRGRPNCDFLLFFISFHHHTAPSNQAENKASSSAYQATPKKSIHICHVSFPEARCPCPRQRVRPTSPTCTSLNPLKMGHQKRLNCLTIWESSLRMKVSTHRPPDHLTTSLALEIAAMTVFTSNSIGHHPLGKRATHQRTCVSKTNRYRQICPNLDSRKSARYCY